MSRPDERRSRWRVGVWVVGPALIGMATVFWLTRPPVGLPSPGSDAYRETVRAFYSGLASVEVGLLDDARTQFSRAAALAPAEPAIAANLAIAHVGFGGDEGAATQLDIAQALAPDSTEIALLQGQLAGFRGQFDVAVTHYRRAADLSAENLKARFALAQELARTGDQNDAAEAQQLLEQILDSQPENIAVLVSHVRLAAERDDVRAATDTVERLAALSAEWPATAQTQLDVLATATAEGDLQQAAIASALLRNVLVRVSAFLEGQAVVSVSAVLLADPLPRFLTLPSPSPTAAPIDGTLAYTVEQLDSTGSPAQTVAGIVLSIDATTPTVIVVDERGLRRADTNESYPIPGEGADGETPIALRAFDWNNDFRVDLAVTRGGSLGLFEQSEGETFEAVSLVSADGAPLVRVSLFANRQGGQFTDWLAASLPTGVMAMTLGDLNADSRLDLVTLDGTGAVSRSTWGGDRWETERVAMWGSFPAEARPASHRLLLADLDNNGGLDVTASGGADTRIWLSDERSVLETFAPTPSAEAVSVVDLDGDGWLDFVGLRDGVPVRILGRGTAGYQWQEIRPRAQVAAGDQRINTFGVGGEIEVRSGLLVQKQVLTGAPLHFGLGAYPSVDVTRIVWPNGVMQADFDLATGQVVVAEQRLKGSCPWLFTYDGVQMRFVTDFLWRSPLGLRINAQETAGVTQTEDRVVIRGDQLVPRDGEYDLRITAELWETHFFDAVSLMVVDHPLETEVYVDERFAGEPVALSTYTTGASRPVRQAWDDTGADVTSLVDTRDGRYLASVERGRYQGVTRDHLVEVELDPTAADHEAVYLLAQGWVYPTDSSINVAIGQGAHPAPRGVALEARDRTGKWQVVHADLGFPAGKNKTIVVELARLSDGHFPRQLRLRTNLEVYCDWIGYAPKLEEPQADSTRLDPQMATLRYRGFSRTDTVGPRRLEIPRYEIANTRPRWRDLIGFHTKFGDVRELLEEVDDRYVIMNAGDELGLRFPAPAPPPVGWRRDFVLIGDGWVKDGDFNTTHSKTVGPLPSHDRVEYRLTQSPALEDDPIYRRHSKDWQTYHTRFVTPTDYLTGFIRTSH